MDIIFRRRLGALTLLFLLMGMGAIFGRSDLSPLAVINRANNTGIHAAGDPYGEWIYADCDGENQQVTVLKDGELSGIESLDSLRQLRLPAWCDLPMVNHESLADWQAQLQRLKQLVDAPNTDPDAVIDAAFDLQLSSLYLLPMHNWLEQDSANAVGFLDALSGEYSGADHLSDTSAKRANLSRLVNQALRQLDSTDLQSARLRDWLEEDRIARDSGVLLRIAALGDNSERVSRLLLNRVGDVDRNERANYFLGIAEPLAARPEFAELLRMQLAELARNDRFSISLDLLARDDTSVEFGFSLLDDFDDIFYGNEAELQAFKAIAEQIEDDERAPRMLARVLQELEASERRLAAIHLVDLDSENPAPGRFTLEVLEEFHELHSQSRERVAQAILRSPQFDQARIQRAALREFERELRSQERRDILESMLRHPQIDAEIKDSVDIALADIR